MFLGIPGFKYSWVFLVCCSMYTQKRSIDGEDYLYRGESTDTILSTYLLVYLVIHINCSNLDSTLTGDHKRATSNLLNCCKYNLISNFIGKQGKNISKSKTEFHYCLFLLLTHYSPRRLKAPVIFRTLCARSCSLLPSPRRDNFVFYCSDCL